MKKIYFVILLIFYSMVLLLMYNVLIYKKNYFSCLYFNTSFSSHHNDLRWEMEKHLQKVLSEFPSIGVMAEGRGKWVMLAKDIYVYSAYISEYTELLKSSCVKFIGVTLNSATELNESAIRCIFGDQNHSVIGVNIATLDRIEESHEQRYTAAFFYCPLPSDNQTTIKHASLFIGLTPSTPAWIPILTEEPPFPPKGIYLNVCVRPFFGSILNIDLGEFITYYSIMGVDHFTFYKENISKTTDVFLKIVKHLGVRLELNPWDMPLNESLIHEYGQLAFIQDCVSRSKLFATHVIIVDLDEFIVPKRHKDLKTLISHLDEVYPNAGSYVVPNAYVCNEFNVDNNHPSPFRVLFQNRRQGTPWEHTFRSKVIVKPDRVEKVGIHFTWQPKKNMKEVYVPSMLALLHHYKNCACHTQQYFYVFSFYVVGDDVVIDDSLIRLRNTFLQNSVIRFIQKPNESWPVGLAIS